jgi:hypothetical protein
VTLDNLADVTARVFASLRSFAARGSVQEVDDPTFVSVDQRRRAALVRAIAAAAPGWAGADRETLAALLDVLWNLPAYERLVGVWDVDGGDATRAITWAMSRLIEAIAADTPPPSRQH